MRDLGCMFFPLPSHTKTVSLLLPLFLSPNLLVSSPEVLSLEREVFPVSTVSLDPASLGGQYWEAHDGDWLGVWELQELALGKVLRSCIPNLKENGYVKQTSGVRTLLPRPVVPTSCSIFPIPP